MKVVLLLLVLHACTSGALARFPRALFDADAESRAWAEGAISSYSIAMQSYQSFAGTFAHFPRALLDADADSRAWAEGANTNYSIVMQIDAQVNGGCAAWKTKNKGQAKALFTATLATAGKLSSRAYIATSCGTQGVADKRRVVLTARMTVKGLIAASKVNSYFDTSITNGVLSDALTANAKSHGVTWVQYAAAGRSCIKGVGQCPDVQRIFSVRLSVLGEVKEGCSAWKTQNNGVAQSMFLATIAKYASVSPSKLTSYCIELIGGDGYRTMMSGDIPGIYTLIAAQQVATRLRNAFASGSISKDLSSGLQAQGLTWLSYNRAATCCVIGASRRWC